METTNYLIIGSGIAGLTLAIKTANRFPNKKITIVTKSTADESNTKYAQGGIAVVTNKMVDSYEKHIQDTLICGDGQCDEAVVKMVITEGPERIEELINWGAQFDKNAKGNFDLGKEGGHSQNRVLHHKDQTGFEIERAILEKVQQIDNICVLDHHFSIDLIKLENCCLGATVLNQKTNELITFQADYTIIATGGIGHLYGHTTNPIIATGDGIAMASRANALIKDMEFIQFHPTAFYENSSDSKFLISEAVRGFGAYLRTKKGVRFMCQYDVRGELASRDIISKSIDLELKKSEDDCVYLDCTHLNIEAFIAHFPTIYSHCKKNGINIAKEWIPVIPAQHYLCGGINVDCHGRTSIQNLFACGECSRTGLHGANRLASNSLLEALVYSNKIFIFLSNTHVERNEIYQLSKQNTFTPKNEIDLDFISNMKAQLQFLMRQNAGIVRSQMDLLIAKEKLLQFQKSILDKIQKYQSTTSLYELNNMVQVGILIVEHSIQQKENRGGFMKLTSLVS